MKDKEYISIIIGGQYMAQIKAKPNHWDLSGHLCYEKILADMTENYRKMSDDEIISELKKLKTQYKSAIANNDDDQEAHIQNMRQILTNAYALNKGANLSDIKIISIMSNDYESKLEIIYKLTNSWHDYIKSHPIGNDLSNDLSYMNSQIKADAREKGMNEKMISDDVSNAFYFASIYSEKEGISEFKTFFEDCSLLDGKIKQMIGNGQMPPYGVALAYDWQSQGLELLPFYEPSYRNSWTFSLQSKILNKIHDIVEREGNKAQVLYNVLVAAYCCDYLAKAPIYSKVKLEFPDVNIDKGKFSKCVTSEIDGTREKTINGKRIQGTKGLTEKLAYYGSQKSKEQFIETLPCYRYYIELRELKKN